MVTTADTYRHFAEDCLRWAEETHNEEHRQACLDMAVVWLRLAATGLTESFKPAPPPRRMVRPISGATIPRLDSLLRLALIQQLRREDRFAAGRDNRPLTGRPTPCSLS